MSLYTRIVVPLDGSTLAESALSEAERMTAHAIEYPANRRLLPAIVFP